MVELVTAIARSLVDKPDEIEVKETADRQAVMIELKVAPDDMGKVIGKHGRTAKALRTVAKAAAAKTGQKITIDIIQ